MTKYAVYQLPFENENTRELSFMKPSEIEQISDEYELVAYIDGKSMDNVFYISNACGMEPELETLIERVEPMHSISVGDIIHNLETDETFAVAGFGFTEINMKESV